jgi:hypothetical protein
METIDLQLAKLDSELLDKLFKHVIRFCHELLSLLLGHDLTYKNVRRLKIWEQQNENLELISRYFYQIYSAINTMKVSIEHFSLDINPSILMIFNDHSRWSPLGHNIDHILGCRLLHTVVHPLSQLIISLNEFCVLMDRRNIWLRRILMQLIFEHSLLGRSTRVEDGLQLLLTFGPIGCHLARTVGESALNLCILIRHFPNLSGHGHLGITLLSSVNLSRLLII